MKFCLVCITFLVIISAVSSCTKDKTTMPVPNNGLADSCSKNVSYNLSVTFIVNRSCAVTNCHNATGFKDFSTYALFKAVIDERTAAYVIGRISPGGGMPPSYTTGATLSTYPDN